jgi:hypothetical protein
MRSDCVSTRSAPGKAWCCCKSRNLIQATARCLKYVDLVHIWKIMHAHHVIKEIKD